MDRARGDEDNKVGCEASESGERSEGMRLITMKNRVESFVRGACRGDPVFLFIYFASD